MIDLESKQKVWADQLPLFKENYILTSDLDLLEFDMINGQFDIKPNQGNDGFDDEDSLVLYHSVNTAWAMWLRCNRLNQAEIDSLKAQLAKVEATEQTYWLKDADFVFDSICDYDLEPSPGEVFEFEMWKRTKSEEIYVVPIFSDEDNFDYVEFSNKDDADKAAQENKAMIEAAQENGDE